jgi:hypothetical protein
LARSKQAVCQADLVEDFQGAGVNGVAAERAVEILVRFQERHRNAAPGQEQGEHHTRRASADDATRRLVHGVGFVGMGLGGRGFRG